MSDVITLANEEVEVTVAAQVGGRITSLRHRRSGREWLAPARGVAPVDADSEVFTDTDHCGWDEMVPTVDPSHYPLAPFAGRHLADHGDLWRTPWEVLDLTSTRVHQRTNGVSLPFVFERTIEVSASRVRLEYRCESGDDLWLLWAAHPQFAARRGTRLEILPSPTSILSTPEEGSARPWPGDAVVERDVAPGADQMLYVDPDVVVDAARLIDATGESLTMTWDRESAPYLALWLDHGRFSAGRVVAIEPTNAFVDDLASAIARGRAARYAAHESRHWWVDVTLDGPNGRDQ